MRKLYTMTTQKMSVHTRSSIFSVITTVFYSRANRSERSEKYVWNLFPITLMNSFDEFLLEQLRKLLVNFQLEVSNFSRSLWFRQLFEELIK